MRAVTRQFDIVVSTNSGYPLDLNLYQTVKGMSAAAQIVRPGGSIIMASECRDGVPHGSSYDKLLRSCSTPEELLQLITTPGFFQPEQWQAQIHAQILLRASTYLYSDYLDAHTIRSAYLHPCTSIESQVDELLTLYGPDAQIAVLPEGPQTIAYLCES
jgi:nickel-dependent lactate racemase